MNQVYTVEIKDPMSVNAVYRTFRGRMIISEEGRAYAGEWRFPPKRKPLPTGTVIANRRIVKSGKHKGEEKIFIEGALGRAFKAAGVPNFPSKTKIVVEAFGIWPDYRPHDLGNLEKTICDALQYGGFIPNDSFCLWRAMDFRVEKGRHEVHLVIYEKDDQ